MPTNVRIVDEGPGSITFFDISREKSVFLESNVLLVNRPGISDRFLHKHLIPEALNQGATFIFPLSISYNEKSEFLLPQQEEQINLQPKHIYRIKNVNQKDSADALSSLRSILQERRLGKNNFPVIMVIDTLQKWSEDLEIQIRYLLQEGSYLNLGIWLHTPLYLIPRDLISTVRNVVIIWPSQNEIKLLVDNLPAEDSKYWIESEKRAKGLYIYDQSSGKGWRAFEFSSTSDLAS